MFNKCSDIHIDASDGMLFSICAIVLAEKVTFARGEKEIPPV